MLALLLSVVASSFLITISTSMLMLIMVITESMAKIISQAKSVHLAVMLSIVMS